jgi:hypothetical protein
MPVFLKEREERFPHFGKGELLFGCRVAQKSVESALVRARFAARLLIFVLSPKIFVALWTTFANKTFVFEEGKLIS